MAMRRTVQAHLVAASLAAAVLVPAVGHAGTDPAAAPRQGKAAPVKSAVKSSATKTAAVIVRTAGARTASSRPAALRTAARKPAIQQPRYLFFKDSRVTQEPSVAPPTLNLRALGSFTPPTLDRRRALRAPELAMPSLTRAATRAGATQTALVFTPSGRAADPRALSISLTSRASVETASAYAARNTLDEGLGQAVNMALAVGYKGFSVEAGYLRSQSLMAPTMEGIDVGLSYAGSTWKTSLQVAGLEATANAPLSPFLPDRNVSIEVGGAYAITPAFEVTGGVKYAISHSGSGFELREDVERSSAVYLGTALKF